MRHTMELAIQHIHKNKITSDNGRKRSPMGAYGESLVAHAGMFLRDSVNWNMLTSFGLGERRISEAEDRFADHIKDNYVVILQQSGQSFKEYLTLCRKLESRRLDYDAKYNRLQKAKKESPDSEQSVQSAKVKYEETEVDVVQCMISLQETETEHCDALRSMLEAQLCYHKEAVRILENVKKGWDQEPPTEQAAAPTSNNPTMDDGGDDTKDNCSGTIDAINPRQQRALYDHIQDHDDELTFHVNDIITVLHEVDDAWWFGEISDSNNNKSRGIFPVNYTEPYANRKSSNSNSSSISKEEADIAKLKDDIDQGKIIGPSDDSSKSFNKNNDNNKQTQGTTIATADLSSITSPQASSPLPNQSSSSLVSVQSKATTATSTSTSKKRSSAQQPPPPPPHASSMIPETTQQPQQPQQQQQQQQQQKPQQQQQKQPLIPPAATAPMKPQSPDSIQNTSPTPTNRK
ncbi:hypothetical protein BCR42DRAFT_63585 [Absidia repens]|uniref:SH3 domain-containing protein n=1 Tax=Absidia repens TaxID=90262 RepID=A0A1X2IDI4_9FUNG|nr:hypothetical protein BCR42DRAFT_63585 [Absidia repens]